MDENLLQLNKEEEKSLDKLQEKFGFEEVEKVKEAAPGQPQEDLGLMEKRSVEERLDLEQEIENKFEMTVQAALIKGGKKLTVPTDEALFGEYNKEKFQEKKLHKSRESKIRNKKSRLYRKNQNADKMASFEEKELKERDAI